jgi:hypothetical protein
LGSCHDASRFPHIVQSMQFGRADTDVDSANRYDDPQVEQTMSDILMADLGVI